MTRARATPDAIFGKDTRPRFRLLISAAWDRLIRAMQHLRAALATTTKKLLLLWLLLSFATADGLAAQNVNDFIKLFSTLAQSAISEEAAKKEWQRISSSERACIDHP